MSTFIPFGHMPPKDRRVMQRLFYTAMNAEALIKRHAKPEPYWSAYGNGGAPLMALGSALDLCIPDRRDSLTDMYIYHYFIKRMRLLGIDDFGLYDWQICVARCEGDSMTTHGPYGNVKTYQCRTCNGPTRPATWTDWGEEEG